MCAPLLGASWEEQGQLQRTKGRAVPGGRGASQHGVGRRSCSSAAARVLETAYPPSESPATDQQYWIFYLEAAFQGKITLTGLERSQLNGCVKILMVCQN